MSQFTNILVAVDLQQDDTSALRHAARWVEGPGVTLRLVDCVPEFPLISRRLVPNHDHLMELMREEKKRLLEQLAEPLRAGGVTVTTEVLQGPYSVRIIREVLRNKHDLVIKTAKGTRSKRAGYVGATGMELLRKCPCVVWLTGPHTEREYRRALATVDALPEDQAHVELNRRILELAVEFARRHQAEIHVAYAWRIMYEELLRNRLPKEQYEAILKDHERAYAENLDKSLADYGMRVGDPNVHLGRGEPSVVIPQLANELDIDVIIMGTVARAGATGWLLGNTAESIVGKIECSILAVKPEGFVSPVTLD